MSPRTGRPTTDPKKHDTRVKLSDSEWEKLKFCAEKSSMTKTDIIRKGIDLVYQQITKK